MKILMVTNNALEDKIGGHERYVRELASTLSGRDIPVTIVAKRWRGDSPAREQCEDGVVIERYNVPAKSNPLYALSYPASVLRGVQALVRRQTRDTFVHVHMGLPALPLAMRSAPYLFTFHAPVWRELLGERQGSYVLPSAVQGAAVRMLRNAERTVAKHARCTVVLSEFMRSELAVLDPRAAEQATLLPGGINSSMFHPAAGRNGDRSGPIEEPVLFTARRLSPRTGVDELIRAMPLIAKWFPRVRLKIAGIGAMESELRALAADLGVGTTVEFLGQVSDEDLVHWYRHATIVVLPTRELEGFGLTTAEALACGAAVVGTPAGATPELLAPIDPRLVTRDVSARSIAAAVSDLLGDPARLAEIRERASRRVLPDMGWDRVTDRYIELYERAVSRRSGLRRASPTTQRTISMNSRAASSGDDARVGRAQVSEAADCNEACPDEWIRPEGDNSMDRTEEQHGARNDGGVVEKQAPVTNLERPLQNGAKSYLGPPTDARDQPQQEVDRVAVIWRSKHWIVLAAVAVAAATFAICKVVPKTYQASATVSVALPPSADAAASGQGVTAASELASQYAETATLSPVLSAAAKSAGANASTLAGAISAGTVAGENLIQIRADAPTPDGAPVRANAVAKALVANIESANASQASAYARTVAREIGPLDKQIDSLTAKINAAGLTRSAQDVAEGALAGLQVQRGQLESTVVQNISSLASASLLAHATGGTEVEPQPKLYTIVAFIAALLVAAQLAVTIAAYRRRWHA